MLVKCINTLGILLALAGVIVLFRYGMPYRVKTDGVTSIITEAIDQAEKDEDTRYDRYGRCGLLMIVFGTAMQIAAVWV